MPIFFDRHSAFELPSSAVVDFLRCSREQRRDAAGLLPLDFFCGSDGVVYCVVDAPSAEAVRHSHALRGLACGHVQDLAMLGPQDRFQNAEEASLVSQLNRRLLNRGPGRFLVHAA